MKKNKILSKDLFEATYIADNPEDVKKLQSTGVLKKDDTVTMADDAKTASNTSSNSQSMALKEDENTEESKEEKQPITVEYLSNMKGEKPFEVHGDKYEYVYGRYSDGKRRPAVYCYKNDMTISHDWFIEHVLKHENIQEYNIDENSNISRPKDANGNDITLKARVIINNSEIGNVINFGLNDKNEEVAIVELMDNRKVKVPFNQIVVDDNSRIVREQDIQPSDDVVDNINIPKLQQDVKVLVDKIETILKPYLVKIDKPVEQAEFIAAIAERIGVPREKLSGIIGQLRTISNKTNIVNTAQSTTQVAENRKVIKTIKVKDIKK